MKSKKSPKADLESKRLIYFLTGMVMSLMVLIVVFNWKTIERKIIETDTPVFAFDEPTPVVTQRLMKAKPKPKPNPSQEKVEVVDQIDELIDLKEELHMEPFDHGEEIEKVEFGGEDSDEVLNFPVVENKPIFPGCENEKTEKDRADCFQRMMQRHVGNNFKYPEISKSIGNQGTVTVSFIINKDGSISDIEVLRGVDDAIDAESRRVISKLPMMQPAKQRGNPVRMSFKMPIRATIQ
ncbi:MAG: energy transducer TonB [Cryomorphaceae bacterium]|nr:energy transducer TonB [Cryomorphaceae bacterium]